MQLVVKEYGARGPRRCVLTVALLITGMEAANREAIRGEVVAAHKERDVAALEQDKFPSDEHKKELEAAEQKMLDLTNYLLKLGAQVSDVSVEEDLLEREFAVNVMKMLFPVPAIETFANNATCDREMNRVKAFCRTNPQLRPLNAT